MRRELRDIMDAHHATHAQIGRFYRFSDSMDAGSRSLLDTIKRALDPHALLNPGALLPVPHSEANSMTQDSR